jgi:type IV pilus assembly protein PilC
MRKKATSRELSVLCSQLRLTVGAGMTVTESLRLTAEISKAAHLKKALSEALTEVRRGEQLHEGFLKSRDTFPEFFIHMVRFGEETGRLEEALKKMEVYFDSQARVRDRVKSSLTYPAVVFAASMIVLAGLLTFVVPGFAATLQELGGELPASTKTLLFLSGFIRNNILTIAAAFAAMAAVMLRYAGTASGRERIDGLKLRLPFIRTFFKRRVLADFCRNLSIMVGSGFNIMKALEVCAGISGNRIFSRQVLHAASLIRKGGGVCRSFSSAGMSESLFLSLVGTGEDTGALELMLEKAAEHYEREVENLIDRSLRLLEPAVIVVMAGLTGAIIISVMLPIMSIMDSI